MRHRLAILSALLGMIAASLDASAAPAPTAGSITIRGTAARSVDHVFTRPVVVRKSFSGEDPTLASATVGGGTYAVLAIFKQGKRIALVFTLAGYGCGSEEGACILADSRRDLVLDGRIRFTLISDGAASISLPLTSSSRRLDLRASIPLQASGGSVDFRDQPTTPGDIGFTYRTGQTVFLAIRAQYGNPLITSQGGMCLARASKTPCDPILRPQWGTSTTGPTTEPGSSAFFVETSKPGLDAGEHLVRFHELTVGNQKRADGLALAFDAPR